MIATPAAYLKTLTRKVPAAPLGMCVCRFCVRWVCSMAARHWRLNRME